MIKESISKNPSPSYSVVIVQTSNKPSSQQTSSNSDTEPSTAQEPAPEIAEEARPTGTAAEKALLTATSKEQVTPKATRKRKAELTEERRAEIAENIRRSKHKYDLENADKKADRSRYRKFIEDMNDAIHPIIFKHTTPETLYTVRFSYWNALNKKMSRTFKQIHEKQAVYKALTLSELWHYGYCFSAVFLRHGLIYRVENQEVPLIASFIELQPFLETVQLNKDNDLLKQEMDQPAMTALTGVVDNNAKLKAILRAALLQFILFLRTFPHMEAAAAAAAEEEVHDEQEETSAEQEDASILK